jgi:hypothetical protein
VKSIPDFEYEIILIDYGSDIDISNQLRIALGSIPNLQYSYADFRDRPWSRSHAMNIGFRLAKGKYMFTADIDLIFIPNFWSIINSVKKENEVQFFPFYLLPRFFKYENERELGKNFITITEQGRGISLIPSSVLKMTGGYDERFSYWGYEDNEFHHRCEANGINTIFLSDIPIAHHQWHKSAFEDSDFFPKGWRIIMKTYFEQINFENRKFDLSKQGDLTNNVGWDSNEGLTETTITLDRAESFASLFTKIDFLYTRLAEAGGIKITISLEDFEKFQKATLTRFVNLLNRVANTCKMKHLKVVSKYRAGHMSYNEIRDVCSSFVFIKQVPISDYGLTLSKIEKKVVVKLYKSSR